MANRNDDINSVNMIYAILTVITILVMIYIFPSFWSEFLAMFSDKNTLNWGLAAAGAGLFTLYFISIIIYTIGKRYPIFWEFIAWSFIVAGTIYLAYDIYRKHHNIVDPIERDLNDLELCIMLCFFYIYWQLRKVREFQGKQEQMMSDIRNTQEKLIEAIHEIQYRIDQGDRHR
jgi:hypothetical protein